MRSICLFPLYRSADFSLLGLISLNHWRIDDLNVFVLLNVFLKIKKLYFSLFYFKVFFELHLWFFIKIVWNCLKKISLNKVDLISSAGLPISGGLPILKIQHVKHRPSHLRHPSNLQPSDLRPPSVVKYIYVSCIHCNYCLRFPKMFIWFKTALTNYFIGIQAKCQKSYSFSYGMLWSHYGSFWCIFGCPCILLCLKCLC